VAAITFLLSYLARQANNIGQAIFGWSVSALFGKLPRRAQLLVTGALVLSIAWPLFVVGTIVPGVASWAIAFVPLHAWIGQRAMRAVWIVLAVIAPPIVALLVRAATARGGRAHGSLVASLARGYPIALGFFLAFVVTAVTVPLLKLASIVRGWSDEHVYVEPHRGEYGGVLRALAEACARAGLVPEVSDVPRHLMLATTIMRTMARGAVSPLVADQLRRITAPGLSIHLYPADLVLRGNSDTVARIRSMFGRTDLAARAYLVASPEAKSVQDQLARLDLVLDDHVARGLQPGAMLATRLREIYREAMHVDVPYDEWVILDAMARRFERRLIAAGAVPDGATPIDDEPDALREVARRANQEDPMTMTDPPARTAAPPDHPTTMELVTRTLDDARALARTELELAKQELRLEMKQAMHAGIDFGIAFACGVLVISSLVTSIVLSRGGAELALVFAIVFLAGGAVAGAFGWKALPRKPMAPVRRRLEDDVDRLKEHIA
jgi:hypothetical protein